MRTIGERIVDYHLGRPEWEDVILHLVKRNAKARFLSLGCGQGEFTMRVAAAIGTRDVSGVEIVEKYVEEARGRGIKVEHHDLDEGLPYDDADFDVILSNHVVEHVSNTDLLLRECCRTLCLNGCLLLSTPNLGAFHNLISLALGKQPLMAEVSDEVVLGSFGPARLRANVREPGHRRLFTTGAITGLLEWHGFAVERVVRSGFRPFSGTIARLLAQLFPWYASTITIRATREGLASDRVTSDLAR